MARVYKATVYYVDANEQLDDKQDFIRELETSLERGYLYGIDTIVDADESSDFEWHDDIDLNKTGATKETYEKYFK